VYLLHTLGDKKNGEQKRLWMSGLYAKEIKVSKGVFNCGLQISDCGLKYEEQRKCGMKKNVTRYWLKDKCGMKD
jgi:hypothetical protein